ncbi:helix-turn-helix transcriptional regulator [Marinimicrobium sp. ABcell2]|uniref:helix-turn-helix transcriptional regulator n=1 Tax=Marinimicrobium sp. ABcell2 TaxID=3069751 RepID=UPI0027B4A7D7|nr:helix-turn-helix transcriptional regulator [Marinimicrobium sp. ABcell2]MDQ2077483.1 helix-turn-helix transcriptional regulator [Marinimicrobium sp. ABcell2]
MLTKFGKLVRKYRIDAHMKLGEMALSVGVSPAFLSSAENGKKNPSAELVDKIADVLGLNGEAAEELHLASAASRSEYRINVAEKDEFAKETAAMFARSIESSNLSREQAEKIMKILNSK